VREFKENTLARTEKRAFFHQWGQKKGQCGASQSALARHLLGHNDSNISLSTRPARRFFSSQTPRP
jgi:hypothetical protein